MKISELKNPPAWLVEASTVDADVTMDLGYVVWHGGVWLSGDWHGGVWHGGEWLSGVWHGGDWHGGVWHGGEWRGGEWRGGEWRGGDWHGGDWLGGVWRGGVWLSGDWRGGDWHGGDWLGGVWRGGDWHGGVWHGGEWRGGDWHGGVWHGGEWRGGEWHGGDWHGGEDRLLYMAATAGIVFRDGVATAYRTTRKDRTGRQFPDFIQVEGEYYEPDALPAGSGTCCKGIHVSSASTAWWYFGVDSTCQFWDVTFKREDLLDCDGHKARIRGGVFRKIERPF